MEIRTKRVRTRKHTTEDHVNKSVESHLSIGRDGEMDTCVGIRWSARHPEPKHKFPPLFGCDGPWMEQVKRVLRPTRPPTINRQRPTHIENIVRTPTWTHDMKEFPSQQAAGMGSTPGTNWLSAAEYHLFCEINKLRTNPETYATKITDRLQYLRGRTFWLPDRDGRGLTTREGRWAYEEAAMFLRNQAPVPPLVDAPRGLSLACIDHYQDTGAKGILGHSGSDDSKVDDRVSRYGIWSERCSELIVYGMVFPDDVVVALVVDDGNLSRCHREILFAPSFSLCGIGWGPHSVYETVCVAVLACKYVDKPMQEQRAVHRQLSQKMLPSTFATVCPSDKCDDDIPLTSGIYADGKKWHAKCFVCSICRQVLQEYTSFRFHRPTIYPEGSGIDKNGVFCKVCFEKHCAAPCTKCGLKVIRVLCLVDKKPFCYECYKEVTKETT
eukprot:TRINITY_DN701_c0_g1_i1.p1 TRINITY_DN701_c0_g1~~TRINITY_DN701_c0_g1_i1.p1  ORF type:complete len:450 (+),score=43.45 TRINITY_DN701_c0_g1_i1:31-1350(+)